MTLTKTQIKILKEGNLQGLGTINAKEHDEKPDVGVVYGTAVDYNRVGYPSGSYGMAIAIAPGAAMDRIAERADHDTRDVLGLIAHDHSRVLARTNDGSLQFKDSEGSLSYSMELDLLDPEAMSAYRKIKTGKYTAASIGFRIMDYEETEMVDNSPEAALDPDYEGEPIETILCTDIKVAEVSVLAHGAYGGATTMAARPTYAEPQTISIADILSAVDWDSVKVRYTSDGTNEVWEFKCGEPRERGGIDTGVESTATEEGGDSGEEEDQEVKAEAPQPAPPDPEPSNRDVKATVKAMARMGLTGI